VTTHLEGVDPSVQLAHSSEILDGPASTSLPMPVVLVCDCNSSANAADPDATPTYALLRSEGFGDAWATKHPGADGLTCCQDADLLLSPHRLSSSNPKARGSNPLGRTPKNSYFRSSTPSLTTARAELTAGRAVSSRARLSIGIDARCLVMLDGCEKHHCSSHRPLAFEAGKVEGKMIALALTTKSLSGSRPTPRLKLLQTWRAPNLRRAFDEKACRSYRELHVSLHRSERPPSGVTLDSLVKDRNAGRAGRIGARHLQVQGCVPKCSQDVAGAVRSEEPGPSS